MFLSNLYNYKDLRDAVGYKDLQFYTLEQGFQFHGYKTYAAVVQDSRLVGFCTGIYRN